ncbi:MAG TPA: hydantoinase/oxoprolinase family protein [Conexibacter sp.]|nr:hydantoinase/oxoprolinase family protein [Conexibacter sp.]
MDDVIDGARSSFKVGIDVGGTFTDFVAVRSDGVLVSGKTPSMPGRESVAVLNAIEGVADGFRVGVEDLLRDTPVISFGTTVATNAMLQHKGARVGMVTTRGFRDVIDMRRGYRESLTDIRLTAPQAIAQRRHRFGVTERIGFDGEVLVPLDENDVVTAVDRLRDEGIEAYAVCLLQAQANPVHEQRCAEIVAERHPGAHVSISTDVVNQVGEFERFSTTLVNAFLSPVLSDYTKSLLAELRRSGFAGSLHVMQSNGGTADAPTMGRSGAATLLSGPAGGVVAASESGRTTGHANIIAVDMGGTSYDVSLVRNGRPETRTDAWVARYRLGLPMLDIHTIGAGGGSVAWIDQGGALRVGPESAGAMPGPACYGRGGTRPTVTDANLVLGYLGSSNFVKGTMQLDREAAEQAIREHVAEPLGIDIVDAAVGIARIVNSNMSDGIRYVSVARGHDPRDFALLAFGGAAATHAPVQARDLGIATILVPKSAGVLSALGTLLSDLKTSTSAPFLSPSATADLDDVNKQLDALWERHAGLVESDDVVRIERRLSADFRYEGQVSELQIPIAGDGQVTAQAWAQAIEDFHTTHEQLYTFRLDHKPVEVITLRQDIVGIREKLAYDSLHDATASSAAPVTERTVWLPEAGGRYTPREVSVYDGAAIFAGGTIAGPAIINEANTTICLHDTDRARLDSRGIFVIDVGAAA